MYNITIHLLTCDYALKQSATIIIYQNNVLSVCVTIMDCKM